MNKIKLIINYSYQQFGTNSYSVLNRSIILTYNNVDEITNESIKKVLYKIHQTNAFDILEIKQIIN